MTIAYISNVRLPTERAHGLQIMKMCEAFAATGTKVRLLVPRKRHTTDGTTDPFEYYGVRRSFEINKIWSLDLLGTTYRWGRTLYWLDICAFLFSLLFARVDESVLYAREPLLLLPFSRRKHTLCVEVHDLHQSPFFIPALHRAHRIVVITQALKADLIARGIPDSRIIVAPDGVDLVEFTSIDAHEARNRLSLPPGIQIVAYTGHLYEWKGAGVLAEAAARIPDALFLFVGGIEPDLSRFKKEYGAKSNIRLVPHVPHSRIPAYLASANVLVIPNSARTRTSAQYTSPLKLFEYMASGRTIVASDLPSLREILDETTAYFARPDDAEDLAARIRDALRDNGVKAHQAREEVASYTWEHRARSIIRSNGRS